MAKKLEFYEDAQSQQRMDDTVRKILSGNPVTPTKGQASIPEKNS